MSGIIGKKIGMTSLFDENDKNLPCTVIQAGPCSILQVRTLEVDGYSAVQLGFDDKSEKNVGKALAGHFKKAGRMGGKQVTVQNLQVLKVDQEQNLLVVKGAVPGAKNSYVIIRKWN